MTGAKKYLFIMLAVLLMTCVLLAGARICAAEDMNYIMNGDFETDVEQDWKPDSWTASDDIGNYVWLHDLGGNKVLRIMATSEAVSGETVSQVVYGLPDGVYTLEAQVQGDPAGITSLKLYAGNTGEADVIGENVAATITAGAFHGIKLENIVVTAESCTVGLEVELSGTFDEWDWVMNIDNVKFYKTGELSGPPPTIISVENPAPITTVVNQAPILPAKVVAHLSNGRTSEVAVTWPSVDPALYTGSDKIGTTFTVQGTVTDTVAGEDFTVEISVTVTCKTFDLNGDGTINVGDLAIAAYNYGKKSGDDGWDRAQAADVNGDGEVNTVDCRLISGGILGR